MAGNRGALALQAQQAGCQAQIQGRFAAQLSLPELLDEVGRVARFGSALEEVEPDNLSKAQWDATRERLCFDLPSAEGVRQRVGLPWGQVLTAALLPSEERNQFLKNRFNPNWGSNWGQVSEAFLVDVLQRVANRLPEEVWLTALRYDREVEAIEAENRRRYRAQAIVLPRSALILSRFANSWKTALNSAGLGHRLQPPGDPHPVAPSATVGALGRALIELGTLPPKKYFMAWCGLKSISLPHSRSGWWAEALAALTEQRAGKGLSTPERPTLTKNLPALSKPTGDRRKKWTREKVLVALRLYAAAMEHPVGWLPTERDYQKTTAGKPEYMALSTIQRHYGSFHDACREAGIL